LYRRHVQSNVTIFLDATIKEFKNPAGWHKQGTYTTLPAFLFNNNTMKLSAVVCALTVTAAAAFVPSADVVSQMITPGTDNVYVLPSGLLQGTDCLYEWTEVDKEF
jgi:adenosylcobinamide amidohydrolase